MKKKLLISYEDIISIDNFLLAWQEFIKGKKSRLDVLDFSLDLIDNILQLHHDLANQTYQHGGYKSFYITDPKLRHIHKASVRDRLIHHAVYRQLYPLFDKAFIADSYSCRVGKGTHMAVIRLRDFANKASKNNTGSGWTLKCDIKKFFASINHNMLLSILREYIDDEKLTRLLGEIIGSFLTPGKLGIGLPLGNLTSQLFVNVYMNKFDQFMKHKLKTKHYIRYADDFVIADSSPEYLKNLIQPIADFLKTKLNLELHPQKIQIRKFRQGIDFLGYVILPHYTILRTKTKKRMFRKIKLNREKLNKGLILEESFNQSLQSYYGMLKHCQGHKIKIEIERKLLKI